VAQAGTLDRARRTLLAGALAFAAGALAAAWARADERPPVDLELVLAVDVSGSIDPEEGRLQRQGYVAAFRHQDVVKAIGSGLLGRIAVAYFEWSDADNQRLVADWTLIDGTAAAAAFADRLDRAPVVIGRRTSLSGAIDFALGLLHRSGFEGTGRTIDVSGDGANNDGELVVAARDRAIAQGVTVNGLPIVNERPNPFGFPSLPNLDLYYRDCVIGGPGAFYVVAEDFAAFGAAVRRKLVLEIARRPPAASPRAAVPVQARYGEGCDVGERRLREYRRTNPY